MLKFIDAFRSKLKIVSHLLQLSFIFSNILCVFRSLFLFFCWFGGSEFLVLTFIQLAPKPECRSGCVCLVLIRKSLDLRAEVGQTGTPPLRWPYPSRRPGKIWNRETKIPLMHFAHIEKHLNGGGCENMKIIKTLQGMGGRGWAEGCLFYYYYFTGNYLIWVELPCHPSIHPASKPAIRSSFTSAAIPSVCCVMCA